MEKKPAPPKTVDEYLSRMPAPTRAALEKLRRAIKAAAPHAVEGISWRMPSYKYKGWLVFFAAFKNHNSFIVADTALLKTFKDELRPFYVSGATVRFTADKPLPAALVKKIVKARVAANDKNAK